MAGSCLSSSAPQGHRCSLGRQKLVIEEELEKAGSRGQSKAIKQNGHLRPKAEVAQRQDFTLLLPHPPPHYY